MLLLAFVLMPFLVYRGWKVEPPIRRGKYVLIYVGMLLLMGVISWGAASSAGAYPRSEPTAAERGASLLCVIIPLYCAKELGARLRDTALSRNWVVALSVFSVIGVSWLIALFLPSDASRRTCGE